MKIEFRYGAAWPCLIFGYIGHGEFVLQIWVIALILKFGESTRVDETEKEARKQC